MQKIIGMLGAKGAGKDTAARYLVEQHGFLRVAFADKLYAEVAQAFGVTVEYLGDRDLKETPQAALSLHHCSDSKFVRCVFEELALAANEDGIQLSFDSVLCAPRSPRVLMQFWGTEYRRKRGKDSYWVDAVEDVIKASPQASFVVTDVRFLNEINYVRSRQGSLIRVRRLAVENQEALDRAAKGTAAHPSETEVRGYPVDLEALNEEGQPDSLRYQLEPFLQLQAQG